MVTIYTDGAAQPNPGYGGWAMVAYRDGREISNESGYVIGATNNQMEFEGIYAALRWLRDNGETGVVCSDSQYAINCLTIWWPKWKRFGWRKSKNGDYVKNRDIIERCLTLMPGVRLQWVRGHCGIEGNERADELAGIARLAAEQTGEPLPGRVQSVVDAFPATVGFAF